MPPFVHEIFVSGASVCCSCGIQKRFVSYAYSRRFAEKHAKENRESIIRPFINN